MEGPSVTSALLHSATVVFAGVILVHHLSIAINKNEDYTEKN